MRLPGGSGDVEKGKIEGVHTHGTPGETFLNIARLWDYGAIPGFVRNLTLVLLQLLPPFQSLQPFALPSCLSILPILFTLGGGKSCVQGGTEPSYPLLVLDKSLIGYSDESLQILRRHNQPPDAVYLGPNQGLK